MAEVYANTSGAITTLASALAAGGTNKTVLVKAAAPTALQSGTFRIEIGAEIMLVTAGPATTTWTVERAQEGTAAEAHSSGASVSHKLTAGGLVQGIKEGGVSTYNINGGTPSSTYKEQGLKLDFGGVTGSFGEVIFRHGKASVWTASNPILSEGEIGIEIDTKKGKIGDGVTKWATLPYAFGGTGGGGITQAEAELVFNRAEHPVTIKGTAVSGQVIVATSSTLAEWKNPTAVFSKAEAEAEFDKTEHPVSVKGTATAGQVIVATSGTLAEWKNQTGGLTKAEAEALFDKTVHPVAVTGESGIEKLIVGTGPTTAEWKNTGFLESLIKFTAINKPLLAAEVNVTGTLEANTLVPVGTAGITLSLPYEPSDVLGGRVIAIKNKSTGAITAKYRKFGEEADVTEEIEAKETRVYLELIGGKWSLLASHKSTSRLEEVLIPRAKLFLTTAKTQVFSAGVTGDTFPRAAITNEGTIELGSGAAAPDTSVERATRSTAGILSAPAIEARGIAGTTPAKGAFMGALSASVAPSTGTYAVGDFVIDKKTGFTWVCTVAGAPGTWINPRTSFLGIDPNTAASGFNGQSFDLPSASALAVSGTLHFAKIMVPVTFSAHKVFLEMVEKGSGLTAAQNKCGIYSSAGVLLGETADQTGSATKWSGTAGIQSMLLEATAEIVGGPGVFIWIGVLSVGTTPPKFASSGYVGSIEALNGNLAAATARACVAATGQTALPGSITPASNDKKTGPFFWVAIE